MLRFLTILAVGSILVVPVKAADPKVPTLLFHGQSFFELESSKGTKIVFDPHNIDAYGRNSVKADLVLMSHLHPDHTQLSVIENREKAKIIKGLNDNGKNWNIIDEKFKDVHLRTVGLYHDTMQGLQRGKVAAFVLEMDGVKFVFLGDLGHRLTEAQAKAIGPVDVLFVPVGGVYTLNGADAKKVVEMLKPTKYVIPMHFGTIVFDELLPPDEFLDEQKNVKKYPGNKLEIDPTFKPANPVIAVLNWKSL